MAKHCFVINRNEVLEIFDAETEREQFLNRVKAANNHLYDYEKEAISKIMDGRYNEVFSSSGGILRSLHIGKITTYLGTYGVPK